LEYFVEPILVQADMEHEHGSQRHDVRSQQIMAVLITDDLPADP
jgi:hypothetical protein